MRWLLDTNVWIDAFAGKTDACRIFAQARQIQNTWIGYSAITRLEVLGCSALGPVDEQALRELLAQFEEVPILPAIIDEAIRLRRLYKLKSPDSIIAATALIQQAELVTRNITGFKKVHELSVRDTHSF